MTSQATIKARGTCNLDVSTIHSFNKIFLFEFSALSSYLSCMNAKSTYINRLSHAHDNFFQDT